MLITNKWKDDIAREDLYDLDIDNEHLVRDDRIIKKYEEIINDLNKHFGRVEQVKKFRLMPGEFTQENGELTPTLKLKRKVIMEKFRDEIESLYVE